ncbi:MAG: ABC transporter ATP-binding protein [Leptolyngbya sp. PLA2]|nr:ABC transporter ATP-binding protein [Leptolyngbya sp.]MCE7971015.1 ABC transporter ATP-binding protein [Leptolyngbya sp. PL-A2]GIK20281.1 MAG: ABC transporter permease [Planctomycetota bacterium]
MRDFRRFARQSLRYRGTVALALLFAVLSASGLGAGLVGIIPVLQNILQDGHTLRTLAARVNEAPWMPDALRMSDAFIASLTQDRFKTVLVIISGLGVLTLLGGTANFLHAYFSLAVVQRTVTKVRRDAFHRVIRLPLKRVVAGGASDIVSRIVNDTAALGAGLTALLSRAVAQVTKGIAGLTAAFIADWRLGLVSVAVAPLLYTIIRRLGKRIRRASREALRSQAGLYGAASEALQGLRVVKVHTTERYEAGRFHRINKQVMREMLRVRTARALASPLVEVVSIVVLGFLALVAAKAIIDGQLDPSRFITALIALGAAGASLKPLTGLVNDIQSSAPAAQRLAELLDADPEPGHDSRLPRLPRHRESIAFEGVAFTYPGAGEPALRGIDLRIPFGERVAFVGPNGSGKTTLLSLVPRLFDPDAGRVLIDGRDIREVGVRSLRRHIGVVTQEVVLFRGSVAANIAYGAEGVTRERVEEAARKARADEFIRQLPNGYDTELAEQGLSLSGGQRQRLAIARAILRDPAILILDEATSMIDAESEARIAEAIAEFHGGRTCLIVAHRLSTVLNADRIVVLDAGRIVDQGPHGELIARCETYRQLVRHQLGGSGQQ